MISRHRFLAAIGLSATILLTGCDTVSNVWETPGNYVPYFIKPYRADVHQGNLVTSEMIAQLEKGMTETQVQLLLGVPLIRDKFHPERWDYVYFLERGDGDRQLRRLTVFFGSDGRLDHWISDPMPDETQADQLILGTIKSFEPRPPKDNASSTTTDSEQSTNNESSDQTGISSTGDTDQTADQSP